MDFPSFLSAGDGKPTKIFGFSSSGLLYFNYKNYLFNRFVRRGRCRLL